ncbi:hypothetical protein XANCAGTX0491_001554 [Xanthoria calcicola]
MGRHLFNGLTIAATGDFGSLRSHPVLQQWVERRGGSWSHSITHRTTHLLCTKKAYNRNEGAVRVARLRNIPIVSLDWFEDSNTTGSLKPARGTYLIALAIKNHKTQKKIKKLTKEISIQRQLEAFEKECHELATLLCSDRYQIHRDFTGFAYNIILVRLDVLRNTSERCILKLCATHETPKGYTCLLTHHPPGKLPAETVSLTRKRCDWFTAWAAFEKAFKEKTKLDWKDRLFSGRVVDDDDDGNAFVYARPKMGEPVGFLADDGFPL